MKERLAIRFAVSQQSYFGVSLTLEINTPERRPVALATRVPMLFSGLPPAVLPVEISDS
jgi:hypothetical protein